MPGMTGAAFPGQVLYYRYLQSACMLLIIFHYIL